MLSLYFEILLSYSPQTNTTNPPPPPLFLFLYFLLIQFSPLPLSIFSLYSTFDSTFLVSLLHFSDFSLNSSLVFALVLFFIFFVLSYFTSCFYFSTFTLLASFTFYFLWGSNKEEQLLNRHHNQSKIFSVRHIMLRTRD